MSMDLINQITLNYLMSDQQKYKLNNIRKKEHEHEQKKNKEIYKEQIMEIFKKMLNDEVVEHKMNEMQIGFDYFIEKVIYYIKLTNEHNVDQDDNQDDDQDDNQDDNQDDDQDDNQDDNQDDDQDDNQDDDQDDSTNIYVFNKNANKNKKAMNLGGNNTLQYFTK